MFALCKIASILIGLDNSCCFDQKLQPNDVIASTVHCCVVSVFFKFHLMMFPILSSASKFAAWPLKRCNHQKKKKKKKKKKTHIFNKISKQLLSVVFSGVFQWGLFGQWETNGTFVTRPEEAEEHV